MIDINDRRQHAVETSDKTNDYYRIVIYNDNPNQWPYIRKNEDKLSCLDKQQIASDGGMVMISLSTENGCIETIENGITFIKCKGYRTWKEYNWARWWYITIQNCGSYREPGLELSYRFNMTNGMNSLPNNSQPTKRSYCRLTLPI
ncbi:transmembrane protein 145-like [Amphiura filiformis]|uniref:transmembrane protein 145-like n=1 Tax=Amphiura filiformis TaxID=82378 RepID=UPI003B2240D7